ncbi:hypothetical protein AAHA92_30127 [Salvia divinorum]|uniref:Uncharacterized protein n=1 Tax=Salvia divinorum TaxID=28513 RepID=A0ABD1G3B1_SALDI
MAEFERISQSTDGEISPSAVRRLQQGRRRLRREIIYSFCFQVRRLEIQIHSSRVMRGANLHLQKKTANEKLTIHAYSARRRRLSTPTNSGPWTVSSLLRSCDETVVGKVGGDFASRDSLTMHESSRWCFCLVSKEALIFSIK